MYQHTFWCTVVATSLFLSCVVGGEGQHFLLATQFLLTTTFFFHVCHPVSELYVNFHVCSVLSEASCKFPVV